MAVFKHLNNWTGEDTSFLEKLRHESNAYEGGVSSYDELTDKPSINDKIIQGNVTLDELNIQPKGDYALREELPTKVSELDNDANYAFKEDVPTDEELNAFGEAIVQEIEGQLETKVDQSYITNLELNIIDNLDKKLDKANKIELESDEIDLNKEYGEYDWFSANAANRAYRVYSNLLEELEDEIPHNTSELNNDAGFINSLPSDLATHDDITKAIGDLVGAAPETLDTLEELAKGLASNRDVVAVLNDSIETKANAADLAKVATSGAYSDLSGTPTIPIIPTKVSAFENDKNYLTSYTESDPTVGNHIKGITTDDIDRWNEKSDFSGAYADLTGAPTNISQFNNDAGYITNIPANYITEEEMNAALAKKADEEDIPSITNLETKTDATLKLNEAKGYTDTQIAALIDSAPDTMNTLGEIAQILGDSNNTTTALIETIGTKADKSELENYIKNTDYATSSTGGIVRVVNYGHGLRIIGSGTAQGVLSITEAAETDIDNRSSLKPITPTNLDYAVKSVVGGHIAMTQDEYDKLETKDENTFYYTYTVEE